MNREEALKLLREEPVFWSRMGFCYDPPRAGKDGRQIIFSRDFDRYRRLHDQFEKIGVTLHTSIMHNGWVGDNRYDYEAADATVDAVLHDAPQRLYIPRIKLNPPMEWCRSHPEELLVYYGGPKTAEEIAALVDTPLHDWFGGDTDGYPVNGGFYQDDRINRNGVIAMQSFSSRVWLRDASEALRRLIEHLENGRYGRQILAYQIAFGCCGETTLWGAWRPAGTTRRGDYGLSHRRDFIEWAEKKYGGREKMTEAWGVEPEKMQLPPPPERESAHSTLEECFYAGSALMPDYHEFLSQKDAEAVNCFGRVVHETCDKPSGAFYGYLMVPQTAYAGHLAIDRLLDSPDIDFLCSPRSYYYCAPGEPGGEQCPSRSMNRKKIWLDELDIWTHLDPRKHPHPGTARNMEETQVLLWREWTKNVTCNQNFWWMDLGDGWFSHPQIMSTLGRQRELSGRLKQTPHRSVSEILLVLDDKSFGDMRVSYGLSAGMRRFEREIKLCGAPTDLFRLADLDEMPLQQYKVVCFLNGYTLTEERWQSLKARIRPGATLLWNYAAGIRAPAFDRQNVRRVTGFGIRGGTGYSEAVYDDAPLDFPPLRIDEAGGGETLLSASDGPVAVRKLCGEGGCAVLATEPCLHMEQLRPVLQAAGVHFYAPMGCTVYADNRLLGVFSQEGVVADEPRLPETMRLAETLVKASTPSQAGMAVYLIEPTAAK